MTNDTFAANDFSQLIQQVAKGHHPIKLAAEDGRSGVVMINQEDLATAQAIIKAALGRDVPFLTA